MTFYPGQQTNLELDGAAVTLKKFYTTVAMRTLQGSNDTLNWILEDHLLKDMGSGLQNITANGWTLFE